jgi:hypothetical protein
MIVENIKNIGAQLEADKRLGIVDKTQQHISESETDSILKRIEFLFNEFGINENLNKIDEYLLENKGKSLVKAGAFTVAHICRPIYYPKDNVVQGGKKLFWETKKMEKVTEEKKGFLGFGNKKIEKEIEQTKESAINASINTYLDRTPNGLLHLSDGSVNFRGYSQLLTGNENEEINQGATSIRFVFDSDKGFYTRSLDGSLVNTTNEQMKEACNNILGKIVYRMTRYDIGLKKPETISDYGSQGQ